MGPVSAQTATTWHWTTDAFERAGEAGVFGNAHVDLIDGEVHAVSPQSPLHAAVLRRLARALARMGPQYVVTVQMPVHLSEDTELEPDLAVATGPLERYDERHPGPGDLLLVVEVSVSTLDFDAGTKLRTYAHHHVPECWVVDATRRLVLAHSQPGPDHGAYGTVSTHTTGVLDILGAQVPLDELWPSPVPGASR
jgi:Uma2 family endonuclease